MGKTRWKKQKTLLPEDLGRHDSKLLKKSTCKMEERDEQKKKKKNEYNRLVRNMFD